MSGESVTVRREDECPERASGKPQILPAGVRQTPRVTVMKIVAAEGRGDSPGSAQRPGWPGGHSGDTQDSD